MQPGSLRLAYLADPNSVHTRRWIGFFASRGHEVHLLIGTEDELREPPPSRVEVHRYRRFGVGRLPFLSSMQGRAAIRSLLAGLAPDLLHAHYLSRYGWQARLSGFHPYLVTPWGSDLFVTPRRSFRARLWTRATLRGADLVTVASEQMREAVLEGGADPRRVVGVRFGVDTDRFAPGPVDPTIRARVGLGGRIVFSPRSLRPLYRHEAVVDALAGLPDDVQLVTSGRNADPQYRATLESRAVAAGLGDRLHILDDLDEDEMVELYRAADAVVSVPLSDGLPVTLLEAMACGVPVVAGDLPGVRELLGPVAPEALVPGHDSVAIAGALIATLSMTPDQRLALAHRLRAHVLEVADWRANMLTMEVHYLRLAGRS